MGSGRTAQISLMLALLMGLASRAAGEGVCVTIEPSRDTLDPSSRAGVRVAILAALEAEGVAVDRDGRSCTGLITAYSIQLDKAVTTTLVGRGAPVSGTASSLDEVDLLVRQLVRALVTGQPFATGTGIQDRHNVLRDQAAPRRGSSNRLWMPTVGIGGGMLELPAIEGRGRQRQYSIVAIELREWGMTNARSGLELRLRFVLHDYAVLSTAHRRYRKERDGEQPGGLSSSGWAVAMLASPFAVANYEFGIGFVTHLGDRAPRPYLRAGMTAAALLRFSDPDHRIDLGLGPYAGIGFQLSEHVAVSVEANLQRPVVHDLLDRGYGYFLTTTAMIEVRAPARMRDLGPRDPIPTIYRRNE